MTIEALIEKMNTLCSTDSCKAKEFPLKLKERLDSYKEILDDFDYESYEDIPSKKSIISTVEKLSKAINNAIEHTYNGKPSEAYNELIKVPNWGRLTYKIGVKHSFYRMRSVNQPDKNKIGYKEMFHIPFEKRGIISTQRYSIPGYPCLYLGESSYGCWEEIGQKELDSCLISRLENTKPLALWDLRIPSIENYEDPVFFSHSMRLFPLIIASTFKVDDSNTNFKPEYIIPQILMQLIIGKLGIDGIIYTSAHKNNNFGFYKGVFTNYVIPVKEYNNAYSHCPKLCKAFKITKPTCEEYLKIQHGSDLRPDYDSSEIDEEWSSEKKRGFYNYSQSLFGNIEKWLKVETDFKLNTINPV